MLSSPSTHLGKYIRVLKIRSIYATDTLLHEILAYTPNLKLLKCQIIVQYFNDRPFQEVDMPRLIRALNSIPHSLTELEIMYKVIFCNTGLDKPHPWPPALPHEVCSLRHLAAPRTLKVPMSLLLGLG
jgi:hypothetical protein